MHTYLTLLRGDAPGSATPILATGDEEVIAATLEALHRRLDGRLPLLTQCDPPSRRMSIGVSDPPEATP